jgi:hypothetical protein
MMDNFHIDLTAEGEETLLQVFEIAFRHNAAGGKAEGTFETKNRDGVPALVFCWGSEDERVVKLPSPIGFELATQIALNWLESAKWSEEPEHDGDNARGFHVYVEDWGHVDGNPYAIVAVAPEWAMYGK